MEYILRTLRESPKALGRDRIYIHGEKEHEQRQKSMRDGVYLDPATWKRLDYYADLFGLPHPEP